MVFKIYNTRAKKTPNTTIERKERQQPPAKRPRGRPPSKKTLKARQAVALTKPLPAQLLSITGTTKRKRTDHIHKIPEYRLGDILLEDIDRNEGESFACTSTSPRCTNRAISVPWSSRRKRKRTYSLAVEVNEDTGTTIPTPINLIPQPLPDTENQKIRVCTDTVTMVKENGTFTDDPLTGHQLTPISVQTPLFFLRTMDRGTQVTLTPTMLPVNQVDTDVVLAEIGVQTTLYHGGSEDKSVQIQTTETEDIACQTDMSVFGWFGLIGDIMQRPVDITVSDPMLNGILDVLQAASGTCAEVAIHHALATRISFLVGPCKQDPVLEKNGFPDYHRYRKFIRALVESNSIDIVVAGWLELNVPVPNLSDRCVMCDTRCALESMRQICFGPNGGIMFAVSNTKSASAKSRYVCNQCILLSSENNKVDALHYFIERALGIEIRFKEVRDLAPFCPTQPRPTPTAAFSGYVHHASVPIIISPLSAKKPSKRGSAQMPAQPNPPRRAYKPRQKKPHGYHQEQLQPQLQPIPGQMFPSLYPIPTTLLDHQRKYPQQQFYTQTNLQSIYQQ